MPFHANCLARHNDVSDEIGKATIFQISSGKFSVYSRCYCVKGPPTNNVWHKILTHITHQAEVSRRKKLGTTSIIYLKWLKIWHQYEHLRSARLWLLTGSTICLGWISRTHKAPLRGTSQPFASTTIRYGRTRRNTLQVGGVRMCSATCSDSSSILTSSIVDFQRKGVWSHGSFRLQIHNGLTFPHEEIK